MLLGRKNRNSVSVSVSPCVADEGKSKHSRASQAKKTVIDKFSFQGTHCYDSFCVQKCALCDEQLHKVVNAKHWVIHRGMDGEYYVENNSAIIIFIVLFVWQSFCEFVLFTVARSPSLSKRNWLLVWCYTTVAFWGSRQRICMFSWGMFFIPLNWRHTKLAFHREIREYIEINYSTWI